MQCGTSTCLNGGVLGSDEGAGQQSSALLAGKIYDNLCISYADDGSAQTPMDDFEAYEAYESI